MEKRILLIDDEPALRRNLTMFLLQENYEVEPCESGLKGLNKLEMYRKTGLSVDCVITDLRLPDIDGIKLLKVIKNKYPQIPVIIISGYGNNNIIKEIETEKGDGYLDKPFTSEELTNLLKKVAEKHFETITPGKINTEKKSQEKTISAYAMLRFRNSNSLIPAFRELYFMDNILYCDATGGNYDIILLLQGNEMEEIEKIIQKIKKLDDLEDIDLMTVKKPVLDENLTHIISSIEEALQKDKLKGEYINDRKFPGLTSYVLLEIEREKFENLYPALYFSDNVVSCDVTKGKYDIILLLQAQSFEEIRKIISEKIQPLDGVIRIKECPVIKMFDCEIALSEKYYS
ncbi:MAG TPA: response regulator [Candidatus Eremiobacteraeota bacterium]|nr:MAG: Chemotaxis protein CheY [bacterium ADurb.Bin363]HPZ07573.1 response regulator [Candidatus Eremiobacteraeota bacterium]